MLPRRARALIFLLFGVLLFLGSLAAHAQDARQIASRQEDLKELRERIESLRQELSASEASHSDAADLLRQSERQISEAERRLFDLKKDQARLTRVLDELSQQLRDLQSLLARQQTQLGNLIYQQYLQDTPNPVQLILNGDNPNQLARDFYYLAAIARTRQTLLSDVRTTLQQQQTLEAETRAYANELATVEADQQDERKTLLQQKTERRQVMAQIADKIRAQKQEIGSLRRDEKRLTQLIDRLARLLAEQEAKEAKRRQSQAEALQAEKTPQAENASPKEKHSLPTPSSDAFTHLKGRLRLPTHGEIVGRFGAAREGGDTWKGLYILAPEGSEVKAIANGRVVYAEWMRGFGNLMIIDHGAGYLTVYGNNHSLFKQVGDPVEGGETVGTVGRSGGEQDSGLYFELRHQGRALDPIKWVSLK